MKARSKAHGNRGNRRLSELANKSNQKKRDFTRNVRTDLSNGGGDKKIHEDNEGNA